MNSMNNGKKIINKKSSSNYSIPGKKKMKYSLLTFVLLLCIIELVSSNMQNISKTLNFAGKIKGLETRRDEELDKNKQLKSEIENFNSDLTLESIARNNLKMAGQNEILVIINKKKEEPVTEEKNKKHKKLKNDV